MNHSKSHIAGWAKWTALAAGFVLSGSVQAELIDYSGQITTRTLAPGTYDIIAVGARGGRSTNDNYTGGKGAEALGRFSLSSVLR